MSKRMKRNETKHEGMPELAALVGLLEAHGVEASDAILQAVAIGPGWYVQQLSHNDLAWRRFKRSFDALRLGGGEVDGDSVTVGALAWTFLRGAPFVREVSARLFDPAPVLH